VTSQISDTAKLEQEIAITFNGATVRDVVVDEEFGNVTATVDDRNNVECGFIEDFKCVRDE